jgi:hypothetical protein
MCHSWRGLVHTNHTRCAGSRSGYTQHSTGFWAWASQWLPVAQESGMCMWHWRQSQRPIWGRELALSRLQPPTGGTDGIRAAAPGGWLADNPQQGVPPRTRMCGGGGGARCKARGRNAGEGRGGLSGGTRRQFPYTTPVPSSAIG